MFLDTPIAAADAQPWRIFIDRLEFQLRASIRFAAPFMAAGDLARRIAWASSLILLADYQDMPSVPMPY